MLFHALLSQIASVQNITNTFIDDGPTSPPPPATPKHLNDLSFEIMRLEKAIDSIYYLINDKRIREYKSNYEHAEDDDDFDMSYDQILE